VEHQRPDTTYRRTENISIHNTDVMLISETHFTEKALTKTSQIYSLSYEPSNQNCYNNEKKSIKHHQLNNYSQVDDSVGLSTISTVYLSYKYIAK
jgi:hypothetical protein